MAALMAQVDSGSDGCVAADAVVVVVVEAAAALLPRHRCRFYFSSMPRSSSSSSSLLCYPSSFQRACDLFCLPLQIEEVWRITYTRTHTLTTHRSTHAASSAVVVFPSAVCLVNFISQIQFY